jgi:2,4-dienoyl-CoA reductase-like NADH-dependent reductase (Old Yellow Enzyme family)
MEQYGGSLENRARFVLELVNAIKVKLPSEEFVIAAKLSCHDCKSTISVFLSPHSSSVLDSR